VEAHRDLVAVVVVLQAAFHLEHEAVVVVVVAAVDHSDGGLLALYCRATAVDTNRNVGPVEVGVVPGAWSSWKQLDRVAAATAVPSFVAVLVHEQMVAREDVQPRFQAFLAER
jgi:hypothetical protein